MHISLDAEGFLLTMATGEISAPAKGATGQAKAEASPLQVEVVRLHSEMEAMRGQAALQARLTGLRILRRTIARVHVVMGEAGMRIRLKMWRAAVSGCIVVSQK